MNNPHTDIATAPSGPVPTPFHPGEQAVQATAGVRAEAEARGQRMLTPGLVDAQRAFFAELPYVIAARIDASGKPWAEFIAGESGFIDFAPDGRARINRGAATRATPFNARFLDLQPGDQLGLLGIDLARRRRNRINGRVEEVSTGAIVVSIEQGFGNCPKYISQRPWNPDLFTGDYEEQLATKLSPAVIRLIERSDTFFIASSSGPAVGSADIQPTAWGADISHRGGEPGFLQVEGNVLRFADYPGNNLFNTLGNLQQYPQCGLLLLDFTSGEVV